MLLVPAEFNGAAAEISIPGAKANLTSTATGYSVGAQAPELSLTDIDNKKVMFSSDRPKVLFFMASWCVTCIPEERALARL